MTPPPAPAFAVPAVTSDRRQTTPMMRFMQAGADFIYEIDNLIAAGKVIRSKDGKLADHPDHHGETYKSRASRPAAPEPFQVVQCFRAHYGERGGTRTLDPMIKSHVLYRLSYALTCRAV